MKLLAQQRDIQVSFVFVIFQVLRVKFLVNVLLLSKNLSSLLERIVATQYLNFPSGIHAWSNAVCEEWVVCVDNWELLCLLLNED